MTTPKEREPRLPTPRVDRPALQEIFATSGPNDRRIPGKPSLSEIFGRIPNVR